ncbi:HD-GYP domain-containing protein [Virgibacillus sp. W0430]|uniref:HD-GYP domain-containing protein n=1 Tax=Virgibacillus sp. W0430 TaxID=3391580 RepID=UPI003F4789AA
MQVNTTQLTTGCILLKSVIGPSGRPIVLENTVLADEHITILKKFLIESVHVSPKLANGELFKPKMQDEAEQVEKIKRQHVDEELTLAEHYLQVVEQFKKMYHQWQNNVPIDMPQVRKMMLPLLMRVEQFGSAVFRLQQYSNKQDYIYHHSVSVGLLSAYIGQKMNLLKNEWLQLGLAGVLSDSGMAKINTYYMEDRPLTSREFDEVKQHPIFSYRLVEKIPTLSQQAKLAILQHHERMDGTGYPYQMKGNKIHLYAQIIAVCDTYHAMTCERIYAKKASSFKVIEQLQGKQFSRLSPKVVLVFIESLTNFSIGTRVKLSNEKEGEIVFINNKQPTRPMIKLTDSREIISLENNMNLYIEEAIDG